MPDTASASPDVRPFLDRLEHLPIGLFAAVMGLGGLTLATLRLEHHFGWQAGASVALLLLAAAVFAALATLYAIKGLRFPEAVAAEWCHPVKLAFFPTLSISLILLGTAAFQLAPAVGAPLWAIGTLLQGVLTLAVVSMWIHAAHYEAPHLNPAWFIPAVGNVLVPLVAAPLGLIEIAWLFLSVGLVFWLVLLTLVFNRLVFHHPMPAHLLPTLCILVAPPAVAFLAYVGLNGGVDGFARILYYPGLFFFALVVIQAPKLVRLPFALSWWAYSFPLAALTVATLVMAETLPSAPLAWLGIALYLLLVAVVGVLVWRTVKAFAAGKVLQPHP
ncbi:MAG: C4-dicarboxylate ABC transporter [Geminicoccaceae bacterium]|nr:MAG: C4-dicarboxylate ABC transporter [Geminicoccaceae bacterium]